MLGPAAFGELLQDFDLLEHMLSPGPPAEPEPAIVAKPPEPTITPPAAPTALGCITVAEASRYVGDELGGELDYLEHSDGSCEAEVTFAADSEGWELDAVLAFFYQLEDVCSSDKIPSLPHNTFFALAFVFQSVPETSRKKYKAVDVAGTLGGMMFRVASGSGLRWYRRAEAFLLMRDKLAEYFTQEEYGLAGVQCLFYLHPKGFLPRHWTRTGSAEE